MVRSSSIGASGGGLGLVPHETESDLAELLALPKGTSSRRVECSFGVLLSGLGRLPSLRQVVGQHFGWMVGIDPDGLERPGHLQVQALPITSEERRVDRVTNQRVSEPVLALPRPRCEHTAQGQVVEGGLGAFEGRLGRHPDEFPLHSGPDDGSQLGHRSATRCPVKAGQEGGSEQNGKVVGRSDLGVAGQHFGKERDALGPLGDGHKGGGFESRASVVPDHLGDLIGGHRLQRDHRSRVNAAVKCPVNAFWSRRDDDQEEHALRRADQPVDKGPGRRVEPMKVLDCDNGVSHLGLAETRTTCRASSMIA